MKEVSAQDKMDEITNDSEDEIKNISEKTVERVVAKVIQSEFSGPIPPPNIIKGYEDIFARRSRKNNFYGRKTIGTSSGNGKSYGKCGSKR